MDETLSWKEHVSWLGKKISSRPALLRRARNKALPKPTWVTIYNTMILPLIDYCAVVWDSCVQGSKSYLAKPNRRAACIIEGCAVKSILVYKCINGLAPSYLLSVFWHAHQIHSYFTRQISCACIWLKPPNTIAVLGSMMHVPIIPSALIKDLPDFNKLKSLAKEHFKRQAPGLNLFMSRSYVVLVCFSLYVVCLCILFLF